MKFLSKTSSLKFYDARNFLSIPQVAKLSEEEKKDVRIVAQVLPFRVNSYVVDELINWDDFFRDPIFTLTFPKRGMLKPHHYDQVAPLLALTDSQHKRDVIRKIRMELNPHPAGQMDSNVPFLEGQRLSGIQHKYPETVLFFPSQGQTCHAYCTFCFRWPQFVGESELKFASKETGTLVRYIKRNRQVSDVLFTGGDPMIMKANVLSGYIDPLLMDDLPNLQTIRIGTKSLSYWPYRYFADSDSDEILRLFERIVASGKHLAVMAHFNHLNELETDAVKVAIQRIRNTGAQIRTQSPILRNINDDGYVWSSMWNKQVRLGLVPYYMFVARDTGAQHFFGVPLSRAWEIFHEAYNVVSGICRTVRGPVMSAFPGKIQILGISNINDEKVMAMTLIQSRNLKWSLRPFFAKYNPSAVWIDDLEPAFGEEVFFFEDGGKFDL